MSNDDESTWSEEKRIKYEVYTKLVCFCAQENVRLAEELTKLPLDRESICTMYKSKRCESKVWSEAFDMLWAKTREIAEEP